MSDEYGDAADQAGEGASGPLEPALASRLDTMHRTLSTLGMRIDALVTSTTTYRSALTDRLNEYTELVAKLTRAQTADLEEYRRANDRAATELRQGLSSSEQALERVAARIETMAAGAGGDEHEQLLAEIRSVHQAQEQLGRFLTESLDRFGDQTTGTLDEIRDSLLDVASGEVMGALWDEFRGARSSIDEMRIAVERAEEAARGAADASTRAAGAPDPAEQLEPLRADVGSLTAAVRDLLEQAEVVDDAADAPDDAMLTAVAADVATLRSELARGLVVEPSDALTGAVDQLRADVAGLDSRLGAIDELQRAMGELRESVAEVAAAPPDDGPDPALARVDDGVRDVAQRLDDLDSRLATILDRVTATDELAGLEDRLEQRLGGMDRHLAGIDEVHRAVTDLRAAVDEPAPAPVVEDDATAEELRSVRDRVIALGERLDSIAVLQEAVTSLRDEVRAASATEPAAPVLSEELEGELVTLRNGVDAVDAELRTVRSGVEDIIARLDEGFVLDDESEPPAAAVAGEVTDQIAALRDEVATAFAALRDIAGTEPEAPAEVDLTPVTELLEHLRDDIAELPGRVEAAPAAADGERFATLDPDVVDLLREEIRSAGGVPEDLLDQLRTELVALRRRIKLRAEGEIFTDEQLELIADAVARRLAE